MDDPPGLEKFLRHLCPWHEPPASPPPLDGSRLYTYEPCEDVKPMPDYENVLTD
jgi:hypothetical protein